MAANSTFDITSGVEMQEVDNGVNNALKELTQRYDFRNVKFGIELKQKEKQIILTAPDEQRLDAVWDVLQSKMHKRGVPLKNLKREKVEQAAGSTSRQVVTLKQGIETEVAKEIVKFIKDAKLKKVQASIQADQVRVASPSRDELQNCIALLKSKDFGVDLQFGNFR
jgi:cyclic-di-GMP-binding protein